MKLFGACIATRNIGSMVEFYTKVYGYEPYIDGPDHRFLTAQAIIFDLGDRDASPTKGAALLYSVDDVDAEFARLSASGIADCPPTDKPWGVRSFTIADPDGNTVNFFTVPRR